MLSIGEFSGICGVSTKTLRYYAEIGLLLPQEVDPENGYRYYSIGQLETMLFINRLRGYQFSIEEIKALLAAEGPQEEALYAALLEKQKALERQRRALEQTRDQLAQDLSLLRQGKPLLSYLADIGVQLVEAPPMYLASVRKLVRENEFAGEYAACFGRLFRNLAAGGLTAAAPPMVLFHSAEYTPEGLDTEFAIPVRERATGTRDFAPGLCLKTVLTGPYAGLPGVYARQREWAEQEGYAGNGALYEVYVTDPSQVAAESGLVTEVYYPVKKKAAPGARSGRGQERKER